MNFIEVNMCILATMPVYISNEQVNDEMNKLINTESLVAKERSLVFSNWLLKVYTVCMKACEFAYLSGK